MSLTVTALVRVESAVIAMSQLLAQNTAAIKSTRPQLYTLEELEVRYGGMGRTELKDLLKVCSVWPADTGPGRTTRIPLDHVLLVDAIVNHRAPALARSKVA